MKEYGNLYIHLDVVVVLEYRKSTALSSIGQLESSAIGTIHASEILSM